MASASPLLGLINVSRCAFTRVVGVGFACLQCCGSALHLLPRPQIWSKSDGGEWVPQVSWKAHLGPVWRVSWAHPEFGQLLASCSLDRNVNIWEEQENVDAAGHVVSRWHKRAQLGDALDSVNDVRFAPRHLGLKLAAGSADGRVRVYEAFDVMNLAHWEFTVRRQPRGGASGRRPPPTRLPACTRPRLLQEQFDAGVGSVAALAWSTSPFDAPLMAVCGAAAIAQVSWLGSSSACGPMARPPAPCHLPSPQVWGFNGSSRMWLPMAELAGHSDRLHDIAWAPTIGRSCACVRGWRCTERRGETRLPTPPSPARPPHCDCLAGRCRGAVAPAARVGHGRGRLWRGGRCARLLCAAAAPGLPHAPPPRRVMRRRVHCSVRRDARPPRVAVRGGEAGAAHVFLLPCTPLPTPPLPSPGSVDWNVTGTVLAASSDDGTVRLRRRTLAGVWECVSVIDAARAPGGPGDGSGPADVGDDAAPPWRAPGQATAAAAAGGVSSGSGAAFGASFYVSGGGGGPLVRP